MQLRGLSQIIFGEIAIPDEHRTQIDVARQSLFRRLAPLAAAHSLLSAIVLVFAFWGEATMPLVIVWCYASAVLMFMRLRERRDARGRPVVDSDSENRMIFRRTAASGLLWGLMLAALLTYSGSHHAMVLGVLTASVLCVGALMNWTFARASLAYSLTVGSGAAVGMLMGGLPSAIETIALLAGCIAMLQLFAAANHANFVRRIVGAAALEEAKETVSVLLADFETHSADWLWRTDKDGRLVKPSTRFASAAGVDADRLEGASLTAMFAREDGVRLHEWMVERRSFREHHVQIQIDGRTGWWSISGQPMADGGYRGVASDITRSRDAEARIAYVTEFDSLTDLPNRAMLVRQLELALGASAQTGEVFALMCVDLDNFKVVNDTMGHPAGDAFLKIVAQRLRDSIDDSSFLARLGGDEFAILVRNVDADAASEQAEIIVDALLAPVRVEGRDILTGGSVGVATAARDGEDAAVLMKNAELALYRAKAQGRSCVRFFEPGMDTDARWRADLESDLRSALGNDAMSVFFQPLVDTRSRKVAGYETLLRWNRPDHGLVSPAVFIACAEETGIIVPLGEWVIRRAIEEAALWRDPVKVAINLSPAQMRNPSLVATVVGALAASRLDPARLEIEITESVLMDETEQNLRTLHELRELGIKIALDDFGTGYSSLSYLRAFPFDKIKIDQRFVRDIDTSLENQAIVRAVISLARDLGMRVTAEGVENEQQASMLAGLGCNEVQGYLYSRPIPADEIQRFEAADIASGKVTPLRRKIG